MLDSTSEKNDSEFAPIYPDSKSQGTSIPSIFVIPHNDFLKRMRQKEFDAIINYSFTNCHPFFGSFRVDLPNSMYEPRSTRVISQEEFDSESDPFSSDSENQLDGRKRKTIVPTYSPYRPSGVYWPGTNFTTALYFAYAKHWGESLKKTPHYFSVANASSSNEKCTDIAEITQKENHSKFLDSDSIHDQSENELSLAERIIYLGEKGDPTLHQQVISFEDNDEGFQ